MNSEHIREEQPAEFEQVRELLANCPFEPTEEDLLEVRARVMSRLEEQARNDRRWKWSAGTAAAAAIVAFCLFHLNPSQTKPVFKPRIENRAQVILPNPASIAASEPRPRRRVARFAPNSTPPGLRSVALITPKGGPPLIKMTTSDPNVVILLPSGDEQSDERTQINE